MYVCLSQINPTVGDLKGNLSLMTAEIIEAAQGNPDVIVFPELVTTAYPPKDLLYQSWIWEDHEFIAEEILRTIRGLSRQLTVIYGGLHQIKKSYGAVDRFNAAYIVCPHAGIRIVHKRLLPQYDVFDETRYFKSAVDEPLRPVDIYCASKRGSKGSIYKTSCDVLICEDIWNFRFGANPKMLPAGYDLDPVSHLRGDGPLFVLNGSPFWQGKISDTYDLVGDIAKSIDRPVVWVNQIGAHDDIITGGHSMVAVKDKSSIIAHIRIGEMFAIDRIVVRLSDKETNHDNLYPYNTCPVTSTTPWFANNSKGRLEFCGKEITTNEQFDDWCAFQAASLFLKDYMRRTGFKKIVFGASGGIDSALVGAIAAMTLGGPACTAITMPSKFSSEGSITDAEKLAKLNDMVYKEIPIGDIHDAFRGLFLTGGRQKFTSSLTDENIQPRIRAVILMAESNDTGAIVISTGNKSEIAVGYCTMYGDMCGGIALLADMPKTQVFRLSRFINKFAGERIPQETIDKPPSAELREDQKDTDSLPPYDVLDPMLEMLVEQDMTPAEVSTKTNMPEHVAGVIKRYRMSEYKRQQMPPGAKLRERSFGSGRQMPIASKISRPR